MTEADTQIRKAVEQGLCPHPDRKQVMKAQGWYYCAICGLVYESGLRT
jgi:hypothetical protein